MTNLCFVELNSILERSFRPSIFVDIANATSDHKISQDIPLGVIHPIQLFGRHSLFAVMAFFRREDLLKIFKGYIEINVSSFRATLSHFIPTSPPFIGVFDLSLNGSFSNVTRGGHNE